MKKTLGFTGTGNMAGALIEAAAKSGEFSFLLSNRHPQKAERYAELTGGRVTDNKTVAALADMVFLGVKPDGIAGLMEEIAPVLAERTERAVLVSMLGGTKIEEIQRLAGAECPVIRIMPNTPVAIGEGIILYDCSSQVSGEDEALFLSSMKHAGLVTKMPERLIPAGTALTGCGPAFADLFIEALADGAVACGIPRGMATELAAKMTAGSASLILASGKNPEVLKNEVCSPGGSTIQGVRLLEERAFRAAVMDAVITAYEKNL